MQLKAAGTTELRGGDSFVGKYFSGVESQGFVNRSALPECQYKDPDERKVESVECLMNTAVLDRRIEAR